MHGIGQLKPHPREGVTRTGAEEPINKTNSQNFKKTTLQLYRINYYNLLQNVTDIVFNKF